MKGDDLVTVDFEDKVLFLEYYDFSSLIYLNLENREKYVY